MTDRERILKAIKQKQQDIWPTDTGEMSPVSVPNNLEQGYLNALAWMEKYINSLPAEPSEDLEKVAITLTNEIVGELNVSDYTDHSGHNAHWHSFKEGVIAGANWQKEQMMKGFCYETRVYQDCDGDDVESPFQEWLGLELNEITALPNIGLKEGDKVKVIIVKEDEQCSTE